MHCLFSDHSIRFINYPFSAASVFPDGEVGLPLIASIDANSTPPQVRLVGVETLFVPATQQPELEVFAARNFVPAAARLDVWAIILAPWIDTDLDDADDERGLSRLESFGIARAEVSVLRGRVGPAMAAYNFQSGLWDWANLNLFDALNALSGMLAGPEFRLEAAPFAEFYWQAMEVASRERLV